MPWICINSSHQNQGHLRMVGKGQGQRPPLLPRNITKEAFCLTDCKPDLVPRNKVLQPYLKCSSKWISILYNKQNQKEKELGKYSIDIENATWRKLLGFIYSYSFLCMKRLARYYIIIMDFHSSLRINGSIVLSLLLMGFKTVTHTHTKIETNCIAYLYFHSSLH